MTQSLEQVQPSWLYTASHTHAVLKSVEHNAPTSPNDAFMT